MTGGILLPVPLWGHLLFLFAILGIAAFFSAAETVLREGNDKKLEKLTEEGDKKAALALKLFAHADRCQSAMRSCLFMTGFFGFAAVVGFWADGLSDVLSGGRGSAAVYAALSAGILLLLYAFVFLSIGVFVPARLAARHPEKAAERLYGAIRFAYFVSFPICFLISGFSGLLLRLFRVDPSFKEDAVTEEEIRLMVDAGEEDGSIETNEREMIENIFEFNNTMAADIMVHRTEMCAIEVSDSFDEIRQTIEETGFSRFPIYEEEIDNVIGILSTRSFLLNLKAKEQKTLRELIFEPYFVPESVRADDLFREMQKRKLHMAIVLDEYGGTAGLITMEDLLEQIVGNIYDETDEQNEPPDIEKLSDTLYRMQGTVPLEEIESKLDVRLGTEDDEFSTLSGLIFSRFTTIPADGETPELTIGRLKIQVESIVEHRVGSALVELLPEDPEGDGTDGEA